MLQVCDQVEREQCRDIPRQVCDQVPEVTCQTVEREQCAPVCTPTFYCEVCQQDEGYGAPLAPVQDSYGSPAGPALG